MTPKSPKPSKTSENLDVLMKKDEHSDNLITDESEKQVTRDGTSEAIWKAKETTFNMTFNVKPTHYNYHKTNK